MNSTKKGISIIEILVASAIIGISVVGVIKSLNVFLVLSMKNTSEAKASLLMEETLEVVQYTRDKGWEENIATLSNNTDYYISWNGLDYSLTESPQIEDGKFTRKFEFQEVNRDSSSDDIVSSGGYVDLDTKKVLIEVSWNEVGENKTINSEFLIHNVYQN